MTDGISLLWQVIVASYQSHLIRVKDCYTWGWWGYIHLYGVPELYIYIYIYYGSQGYIYMELHLCSLVRICTVIIMHDDNNSVKAHCCVGVLVMEVLEQNSQLLD